MPGPLKQRTPGLAGDPGLEKNLMQKNGESHPTHFHQSPQCQACAFHEIISLPGNQTRHLCHLLGAKRPVAGMDGCTFIAGQWDADRQSYLTADPEHGNLNVPNLMRPCSGLARSQDGQKAARLYTAIDTHAEKIGNDVFHIGRAQRPGSGDTRAASSRLGSVGALPFLFNTPELDGV